MANNTKDQPGRVQPSESEDEPGHGAEDEQPRPGDQRQSQGDIDDPSERQAGLDDKRKDKVSSPPPGGVDPEGEPDEERTERKSPDLSPNPEIRKS